MSDEIRKRRCLEEIAVDVGFRAVGVVVYLPAITGNHIFLGRTIRSDVVAIRRMEFVLYYSLIGENWSASLDSGGTDSSTQQLYPFNRRPKCVLQGQASDALKSSRSHLNNNLRKAPRNNLLLLITISLPRLIQSDAFDEPLRDERHPNQ